MPETEDPITAQLHAHADLGLRPERQVAMIAAAESRISRAESPRRRLTTQRRLAIPGAAVLAVALTGVAAAATGLWNPSLGADDRGRPTTAMSPVPSEQLQLLGIVRRPADQLDRDAVTQGALRYLDKRFEGVRTDRIRAAHGQPNAERYLVVPVERSFSGTKDALCLYAVETEGGGLGCWNTEQIRTGQAVLLGLSAPTNRPRSADDLQSLRPGTAGASTIGLVPDGVASVTAANGTRSSVHDNVYVLPAAATSASISWFDADQRPVPKR